MHNLTPLQVWMPLMQAQTHLTATWVASAWMFPRSWTSASSSPMLAPWKGWLSRRYLASRLGMMALRLSVHSQGSFLRRWQRRTPATSGLYQISKSGGKRVPRFPIFLKNGLGRLSLVQFQSCAPFWANHYGQESRQIWLTGCRWWAHS